MRYQDAFAHEFRALGFEVDDPGDFVSARCAYPEAIPGLIGWLEAIQERVNPGGRDRFRESVVRALTVKEARGTAAPQLLIREFQSGDVKNSRWAIGNALSVVAGSEDFDDIAALVSDQQWGRGRQMLSYALVRSDSSRAREVLLGLLDDPDVAGHAVDALTEVAEVSDRIALEPFLEHPKAWVRRAAQSAIRRIDKMTGP